MLRFRFLPTLVVCAAALLPFSAVRAQAPVSIVGPAKIGVVNFQKAIQDTQELKKAQADMIAKFKPRQDEFDKANRDLADTQAMLQNSQGKLSPAAEADLQGKSQRQQRLAERMKEDLDNDVQQEQNATVQRLGTRMTEIVKKMMDEKGLDIILDTSSVVSYKETVNLTAEATAAYDKAYPVTAAAAAAAKKP